VEVNEMNAQEQSTADRGSGRYYREFIIGEHQVHGDALVRTVLILEGPTRVKGKAKRAINAYFLRREKRLPGTEEWVGLRTQSDFVKLSPEDMFSVLSIVGRVHSERYAESREIAMAESTEWRESLREKYGPVRRDKAAR
jgi:hypothetical protein